jgi:hypothetical protein
VNRNSLGFYPTLAGSRRRPHGFALLQCLAWSYSLVSEAKELADSQSVVVG